MSWQAIWLRLKRPKDAIPILQAAIRGSFEGGNLYVTRDRPA